MDRKMLLYDTKHAEFISDIKTGTGNRIIKIKLFEV